MFSKISPPPVSGIYFQPLDIFVVLFNLFALLLLLFNIVLAIFLAIKYFKIKRLQIEANLNKFTLFGKITHFYQFFPFIFPFLLIPMNYSMTINAEGVRFFLQCRDFWEPSYSKYIWFFLLIILNLIYASFFAIKFKKINNNIKVNGYKLEYVSRLVKTLLIYSFLLIPYIYLTSQLIEINHDYRCVPL